MVELGYALSGEVHAPDKLVDVSQRVEEAGFDFALISDHFHPWIERQDESVFVWNLLGAFAEATDDIPIGTGVTCPTMRYHPAIVAQAAATSAAMLEDRFFLGVGTGERLNEHVVGERWPPHHVRMEMLAEAVEVIRDLWEGEMTSHDGEYYTVENAKMYTMPDEPPDIHVAAAGTDAAELAGRIGDGLINTAPDEEVVQAFEDAHDGDAPKYGQATACWAETESEARQRAHEWWPIASLPGELSQELATPKHFDQATELVDEETVAESFPCTPDADEHVEALEEYVDAGFEHVYVHGVGPDQEGFVDFYEREVLPSFT